MNDLGKLLKQIGDFFVNNGINIIFALFILVLGYFVIKYFGKLVMAIIYRTRVDNAIGGFFVSIIQIVLWIVLFFGVAAILGVSGNSFLVVFSSIALAIGLALKDSLANIANGIVIIIIKPFKKGDHVSVDGVEGTIKNIRILTTELMTFDNKKIVIPNSKIVNSSLINYTANPTRRLDVTFSVSYDSDMELVKSILTQVIDEYKYTLKNPQPIIYMSCHNSSSIDYTIKFWVNTVDYWNAANGINEKVFIAFKEHNVEIPFPQVDVHMKNNK